VVLISVAERVSIKCKDPCDIRKSTPRDLMAGRAHIKIHRKIVHEARLRQKRGPLYAPYGILTACSRAGSYKLDRRCSAATLQTMIG
jgi:hypothetical protein